MEKKMQVKHHKKHGQQLNKPLDAYELYELEHMPNMLVKLPTDHPKPRAHEAYRPDYYDMGREVQPHRHTPGGGNRRIFRPDYYETGRTVQPYWYPQEDDDGGMVEENIDAEAENFIQMEHEKFELSNWMSMNTK